MAGRSIGALFGARLHQAGEETFYLMLVRCYTKHQGVSQ